MRSNVIDYYRALSILLVTTYHIQMSFGHDSYPLPFGFNLFAPMGNGWIGVGIFFIISGYCMGMSTAKDMTSGVTLKNSSMYLFKRFLRIAPAYSVSIIIWFLLINYLSIRERSTGFFDIATHVLFIHNLWPDTIYSISGVYWSIGVEMQFYFALPFVILIAGTWIKRAAIFTISLVMTFSVYHSDLSDVYKVGLPNYMSLFIFGWILYEYRTRFFNIISKLRIGFILLLIALIMLFYKGDSYNNHEKIYELVISTLFGLSMIYFANKPSLWKGCFLSDVVSLIGRASFSIYLYNYIFFAAIPVKYNIFTGFILMIAVFGFGIIMYNIVEVQTERLRKKFISSRTFSLDEHIDKI